MAKRVIDDATLTAIADSLRESSNAFSGGVFTPMDMPEVIRDLRSIAYDEGHYFGYEEGETAGVEQGKKAERTTFWNTYQIGGTRTLWQYAFYDWIWQDSIYNPIYDMNVSNALCMFTSSRITNTKVAINITASGEAYMTFYNCINLHTIPKLGVVEGLTYSQTFYNCKALQNITIEGTIGNSFNIKWSPLTKASIESVVNALSDTATGKTVTFKKSAVEAAFPWFCAYSTTWDTEVGTDAYDWDGVIWTMGIGDYVEIGEYVFISFADTNVIVQKTGDRFFDGINEGDWSLIAYGADLKDEWGDFVASKPNWTISLV